MMSSAEGPASTCPVEGRLNRLMERGYRFIHPSDQDGRVTAVVGVRPHDTVIDVVRMNGEDDVVATRMPGDEPDILKPRTVLWRRAGHAESVLDELLALPDTAEPPAGEPVRGCWVPGEGGRAKWVSAAG